MGDLDGMVAWWQANCDAVDHVGGNIATMENGAGFDVGKVAAGFKFDGLNDRLRAFPSPTLDIGDKDGISLEFWIKPDVLRDATLMEWGDDSAAGVSVKMRASGAVEYHVVDTTGVDHVLTIPSAVAAGQFRRRAGRPRHLQLYR